MTPTEQFGPYRVYEQLGIGGMASVHRAEIDGRDGYAHSVALKRMLPHVAANDEMVAAFAREAKLASYLKHTNVARTFDMGRVDDTYFIAMELVLGYNLREILKHGAVNQLGPMPVPVAMNILNQICDALDYAHNLADETGTPLGIIHRDVTPSNIIVSHEGVVKLIDFGIAKASSAGLQTMSGTLKGKFGYIAPEYIAGSLDARADLFALGVIAHELLTNRPLFTGSDDIETLQRVQRMEIQPPSRRNPSVPREIDDIVMTGLARDPNRRWQHATALRTALGTVTRRLGLVASNLQVVQWLAQTFASRPLGPEVDVGDDPSMVITAEPLTSMMPAGTPRNTLMGHQSGSVAVPRPGSISGSHPLPAQPPQAPEYQAAVARYERHSGLSPAQPVMAAEVRSSQPSSLPRVSAQQIAQSAAKTVIASSSAPLPLPVPTTPMAATIVALGEAVPPSHKVKGTNWPLVIVLVLAVAAGAAAVVYFLLPRFT